MFSVHISLPQQNKCRATCVPSAHADHSLSSSYPNMPRTSGATRRRSKRLAQAFEAFISGADTSDDVGNESTSSLFSAIFLSPVIPYVPDVSLTSVVFASDATQAPRRSVVRKENALKGLCRSMTSDKPCTRRRCRFPHSQYELEAALTDATVENASMTTGASASSLDIVRDEKIHPTSDVSPLSSEMFSYDGDVCTGAWKFETISSKSIFIAEPTTIATETNKMKEADVCGSEYSLWKGQLIPFGLEN